MAENIDFKSGCSEVNGLNMYYEIYGVGDPLVLIHGGGSTIQTSFEKIIPFLAKHRQVIGVELQAHGRTNDRNTNLTFEQDAADVAALLNNLQISKAGFFGFSNGGHTVMEIAIRYPDLVNKIIIASAFYKRSGVFPQFWDGMNNARFSDMPQAYKDEFLKLKNDKAALLNMFHKDVQRMQTFKDWSDDQIKSIKAPTLIVNGNADVGSPEHAVEMFRLIPNSQLAILPGAHGEYMGELATFTNDKDVAFFAMMIEQFLDKPNK